MALLGSVAAALRAADPARLVRESAAGIGGRPHVIAIGKAAVAMTRGLLDAGVEPASGVVIAPAGTESAVLPGLEVLEGDHPAPTERSLAAGRGAADIARAAATARGELVVLLSGGASALAVLPWPGVRLGDLCTITLALLRAGATVGELNRVRKHCDLLKGGGLARLATPARVRTLVLSDVVGDPLETIGSGPTAPDPTTYAQAWAVLERYGLTGAAPSVSERIQMGIAGRCEETVKPGDACLRSVEHRVVGSNAVAVRAAAAAAGAAGFRVAATRTGVEGEAAVCGRAFANELVALRRSGAGPACVAWGGETTVTVRGGGAGGRNQEAALAAAIGFDGVDGVAAAMFATDGVDGPTDAAGGLVSAATLSAAREAGLDPAAALAANDSHAFLARVGALIRTGPTGTNVNDVWIGLAW